MLMHRPGSRYEPEQLIRDCERILRMLGRRKQMGFYTVQVYEDEVIEIHSLLSLIFIYYKHHDGRRTESHINRMGESEEPVYQGSLERILTLSVRLDDHPSEVRLREQMRMLHESLLRGGHEVRAD